MSDIGGIVDRAISRERFIRLGAILGVGAASASVLAACGGGSGGESGGGYRSGGSGGGGGEYNAPSGGGETTTAKPSAEKPGRAKKQASGGQAIARASEVQPGSAVKFKDAGDPAVLVHLQNGDFVAYSAICTHQGCTVAYRNGLLACPCHGSVFDPANNGQVVSPPARRPLPEIPVELRGGEVFRA